MRGKQKLAVSVAAVEVGVLAVTADCNGGKPPHRAIHCNSFLQTSQEILTIFTMNEDSGSKKLLKTMQNQFI